ncbi:hypothetical protein JYT28_00145 [Desulfobulbus sp. AH-315-M07]|nr:hypothetical protein [Desulfobulbus sp. AH-315-M07]
MINETIGHILSRFTFLAFAGVVAVGCSDDFVPPTTVAGGTGAGSSQGSAAGGSGAGQGSGASGTGGSGGAAPVCNAPEPAHSGEEVAYDSVNALYIDQEGAPAPGVNTTVCGTNICSNQFESNATGAVTVMAEGSTFENPRFNVSHLARGYAKLSGKIPAAPTYDFGTVRVFRFAPFTEGVEFTEGASINHGGVTLELAAGTKITHDLIIFAPEERVLLGLVADIRAIAPAELPSIDPTLGIEVLVAVSPNGTYLCPAAKLSFGNIVGWAAGANVEILINGAKIFKHYAPYGDWSVISQATVSADGYNVVTNDGQGVELLGTFGARLVQ